MKSLLAFLIKHHFVFVFLLLQALCIWLMSYHKGFQGSHILNSSNAFVGNIYQISQNTSEYFNLKYENQKLSAENALLRNLLLNNYNAAPQKQFIKNDTLYKQQYIYLNAQVVNSSVNKRRNYLTLNIGKHEGVGKDMAVASPIGIIGIVTDVSEHFSSVMSVLHKDTRVNCELKKDGSYGTLIWDGRDYDYCNLTEIPTHAKIKQGDTIITSELSGIFPKGLMVGTIESYERRINEAYYTLRIKLSANLKRVNHVYVIINKMKGERDSLERKAQIQIDN
ncbi:MAG: rod shape-determining protein MreC [Bacteroidetes bacterium]|nr:rod shape-determining protein MreC [Bacteroidota bacterium]